MLHEIRRLARRAHAGQVDKLGRDYADAHLAPIADGASVFGPDAEAAGWLHDILEDTPVTARQLAASGVPPLVIEAVVAVTRRADETYEHLIGRAAGHPLGCLVKLADNAWNLASNPGLAAVDPDAADALVRDRYRPARERLLAAAGLCESSPAVSALHEVLDRHLTRLSTS